MAFRKHAPADHPLAALVEAAGLRWLTQAADDGGARVVPVLSATAGEAGQLGELVLDDLVHATPDDAAGADFGRGLARTHRWLAEAGGFGTMPPEHPDAAPAYFGPAEQPLILGTGVHSSWGRFLAEERIDPVLRALAAKVSAEDLTLLEHARDRIHSGALDDDEPPALIHGDLWAGNVVWTPAEDGSVKGVLIDPSAHAGHRESDIALLELFGLPQLEAVLRGYQEVYPLRPGWQDRIPLHQFFCLCVHRLLFGSSYQRPTLRAAEAVLGL